MLSSVAETGKDWDRHLPFVLFAYHNSVQESTKESPFYLLHGRCKVTFEKEKERLSHEIMRLWQSAEDISLGLAKQKSKATKLKAFKAQLNFRKRVIEQTHENKEIFLYHLKS